MKIIRFFIPLMLFCAALSIQGCAEDEADSCADISCQNGGTCADGTCSCPAGFTGELCETPTGPCANVNCGDNGTCVDGTCVCDEGFSGANCQTELRAGILGDYIADDNCMPGNSYVISITANSGSGLAVNVSNIGGYGFTVVGTVNELDPSLFSIAAQSVTINGNPATITASGIYTLSSGFNMNYTTLINGTTTSCNVSP